MQQQFKKKRFKRSKHINGEKEVSKKMKLNVLMAGQAGQGLDKISDIFCTALTRHGLYVFNYRDYQSRITGGTSFNVICISDKPVSSFDLSFDIAMFIEESKLGEFLKAIKPKATIILPTAELRQETKEKLEKLKLKLNMIGIEADNEIKKHGWNKVVKNTILVAMLASLLGLKKEIFLEIIEAELKKYVKDNQQAFEFGYGFMQKMIAEKIVTRAKLKFTDKKLKYFKGNEAIAHVLAKSGIEAYLAYPMTPSTSLLNEMAKRVFTWQPESEIAVINAALGIAACGKKVAIGSSGGGFALMIEALSFAGMAELPLIIYLASRYGPSTGAPTYTSQADLKFAINAGHGSFAKVVVALSTAENAMLTTVNAVHFAYKHRMPVILLADKHFAESGFSIEEERLKKIEEHAEKLKASEQKASESGMREGGMREGALVKAYPLDDPFAPLPAIGKEIFKLNSYEHDEYGFFVENAESLATMSERRKKRIEEREKRLAKLMKGYALYGKKNAKNLIVAFGSTVNVLIDFVNQNKNYKLLELIALEPILNKKEVEGLLAKAKKIFVVECSPKSNLLDVLKENVLLDEKKVVKILKHDGRPFTLEEIKARLK
jgi:2-oxoglutarate ferredoxin oxidoreductase subunit alpha